MIEILTSLLVIITAFYAWVTHRIAKTNEKVLRVMQEQTVELNRPYITVAPFTIPGDEIIYLRISNAGRTVANKLALKIDRDFFQFAQQNDDRNLAKLNVFQNQIDSFPPRMDLNYYLGTGPSIFGKTSGPDLSPNVFNITATYSFADRTVTEVTTVDLRPYFKTVDSAPLITQLKELIKAIKDLKDKLK